MEGTQSLFENWKMTQQLSKQHNIKTQKMEKFYFIKTLFLLPQIGFSHLISDVFLTVYYASKVHKTKSKHSQKIIFSGPYKKTIKFNFIDFSFDPEIL